MEDDASKNRTRVVQSLAQMASADQVAAGGKPWDTSPLTIAHELRTHILNTMGDADKGCDSGGGDGGADLWPWIGGREYYIHIEPSKAQLKREGLVPLKAEGSRDE